MYKIKNSGYPAAVHVFAAIVVIFTLLSYFHDVAKIALNKNSFIDFGNYYLFAKYASPHFDLSTLRDNGQIMQRMAEETKLEGLGNFGYQPFFYYLLKPFTLLDFKYARILWFLMIHILLFFSLGLLIRLINPAGDLVLNATLIFLAFAFQPLKETVAIGNSDIFILFFLVLSVFFLQKKSVVLSGIFLAGAAFIKFSYGFLFFFFLWKRNYRIFFSALTAFILLELLAILILGLDVHLAYLKFLQNMTLAGTFSLNVYSHSVRVFFYRLLGNRDSANLLSGLSACVVIALTLLATRKKNGRHKSVLIELSLWIAAVFLISPYSNINHFIILYLPFFILLPGLLGQGKNSLRIIYIIAFMLTGLRYSLNQFPQFFHGILSIFSNGLLYGTILLYILIFKVLGNAEREISKEVK